MAKDIMARIERDLLDEKPLDTLLRKLILLGGTAGSTELREWASSELRGYEKGGSLPPYRTLTAVLQIDGVLPAGIVKHQTISSLELPDFVQDHLSEQVELRMGVSEIQGMIEAHNHDRVVHLVPPSAAGVMTYMNREHDSEMNGHITALYWAVSTIALDGVLDQIRTRLAELIAELRSTTPTGQDMPTATQATNAVHFVINGRRNNVNIAQASDGGVVTTSEGAPPRFWTGTRIIGSAIVGVATIVATVVTVWQFAVSP